METQNENLENDAFKNDPSLDPEIRNEYHEDIMESKEMTLSQIFGLMRQYYFYNTEFANFHTLEDFREMKFPPSCLGVPATLDRKVEHMFSILIDKKIQKFS